MWIHCGASRPSGVIIAPQRWNVDGAPRRVPFALQPNLEIEGPRSRTSASERGLELTDTCVDYCCCQFRRAARAALPSHLAHAARMMAACWSDMRSRECTRPSITTFRPQSLAGSQQTQAAIDSAPAGPSMAAGAGLASGAPVRFRVVRLREGCHRRFPSCDRPEVRTTTVRQASPSVGVGRSSGRRLGRADPHGRVVCQR